MISIIAAVAENLTIGKENRMPWHLPADLQFFKQTTMDHTIIMGRKTFESFGKPLPGRRSIVVTRNASFKPEGVETAHSLKDALALTHTEEEIFVIGGGEIYRQALPLATRLFITFVHHQIEGDTFFPEIKSDEWVLIHEQHRVADEKNLYAMTFRTFERKT